MLESVNGTYLLTQNLVKSSVKWKNHEIKTQSSQHSLPTRVAFDSIKDKTQIVLTSASRDN